MTVLFICKQAVAGLLNKSSCLAPTLEVNKFIMEQHTLKNVTNGLNTNIYSYVETSCGKSYNPYLNVVHFFNTRVI
jgi:hypothetical protein